MDEFSIRAYAKINLGLDVIGRLPNGYHQVKMIMQSIDLWDELTFRRIRKGISVTSDSSELPLDENNLIYKAAALLLKECNISSGVGIHLKKNIPIAAGMAGGSTDAAAALKGVCRLFDLNLPQKRLMEYGVSIGADVPYCLMGGTALAEGIGEKLTALPPLPDCHILTVTPKISVSTKSVYQSLDAQELTGHPDIDGIVGALSANDLAGVLVRMDNVLETVTVPAHPVIRTIKDRMRSLGAAGSLMSGSGPTVFGIFPQGQEASAKAALDSLRQEGLEQAFLVRPI